MTTRLPFFCAQCEEIVEGEPPYTIEDNALLCSERCYHAYTDGEWRTGFAARFGFADEEEFDL